ncbi:MAG: ATP-dependent DNA helicase RecG [Clostridia bacterium]|nr:ATP-dependent DNA helicase RecG [Clostridia bacterium]MDD4386565.1 ATP-dependent DNA helicase RecG [Clostridia bacterium]
MEKTIDLETKIQFLKGVGPVKAEIFNKIGIHTLSDLIKYYPRVYEDRTELRKISEFIDGDNVLFTAKTAGKINIQRTRNKLTIHKIYVTDGTDSCQMVWFNQKYLSDFFKENTEYVFYGKVSSDRGMFVIENAVIYNKYDLFKIMGVYPIYPLTTGLTQKYLFNLISNMLESNIKLPEILSEDFRKKYGLCDIDYASLKIHFPKNFNEVAIARKRLIFEELFKLTLALQIIKGTCSKTKKTNKYINTNIDDFLKLLPFQFTAAQKKVTEEIKSDMSSDIVMNRMIQGDVGSGKTIVAASAIYISCINGYQSAMMAPTTILANQHYLELKPYFDKLGFETEIITSTTTKKQKEKIIERLKNGEINIIFGTHSLIEDNIEFNKLGLVITDEQHRFGVKQRMKLVNKSTNVETLVMTATPIPRTLALMLYGDLNLSIIDELPPGRKHIGTFAVDKNYETRINSFIAKEIIKGRQVYVVCPLVDENETLELKSVIEVYNEYISGELKQFKTEFIYGKMKSKEKDEIMKRFKNNEFNILISTTVIEVGVNVPNATMMIIENADRFGLAALHQLRGRVGRGEHESYCILKSSVRSSKVIERLKIMEKSNNGFEIAEKDLELRGPGDFFGIRQSGLPEFKLADLLKDMKVLQITQVAVKELLQNDRLLEKEENQILKREIYNEYGSQLKNIGM